MAVVIPGDARQDSARRRRARSAGSEWRPKPGVITPGSRFTSPRIVSKAALPSPITIAARRVVTGTPSAARRSPVSRRLRRCAEVEGSSPPSPPRYTICFTPARAAQRSRRSPRPAGPAARSRGRRASGRGSRRRRLLPRAAATPVPAAASAVTHRVPSEDSRGLRETATTSCASARSGRSACPITPVAPKTATLTAEARARAARSTVGSRRHGMASGPSCRGCRPRAENRRAARVSADSPRRRR